mmetsp:Transcript_4818/g.9526  ORF Transcript_4818/g.9526 Transcript_4818/m.9526 type:complete len:99 (+) Transcript_4818:74-370(+)
MVQYYQAVPTSDGFANGLRHRRHSHPVQQPPKQQNTTNQNNVGFQRTPSAPAKTIYEEIPITCSTSVKRLSEIVHQAEEWFDECYQKAVETQTEAYWT